MKFKEVSHKLSVLGSIFNHLQVGTFWTAPLFLVNHQILQLQTHCLLTKASLIAADYFRNFRICIKKSLETNQTYISWLLSVHNINYINIYIYIYTYIKLKKYICIIFIITYMYYAHLASVRFEHSVCGYIYIYIYI